MWFCQWNNKKNDEDDADKETKFTNVIQKEKVNATYHHLYDVDK